MTPEVSVIVLCYNQRESVGKTIEAIIRLNQGFDYEIILGDDCSTDGCREECERYASLYPDIIRLMPREPNLGIVRNYERCLIASRGKYIADCSADDLWVYPGMLRLCAGKLDACPQLSVVYGLTESVDSSGRPIGTMPATGGREVVKGEEILLRALNHENALPYVLSASVYRKESLMKVYRDNPEAVLNPAFGMEDLPIVAALASQGDALEIPSVFLRYLVSDDSVSNSSDLRKLSRFYALSLHTTALLCDFYGVDQTAVNDMFRCKTDYLISSAFNNFDREIASIAREAISEWMLPLSTLSRLQLMAMENESAWKVARKAKNLIKKFPGFRQ